MTGFSDQSVAARLHSVRERVAAAARAAGRDAAEIRLVGVSKRQPVAAIRAALDAGLADLGENFVQEAVAKMDELGHAPGAGPAAWHFIGALQSNKTAAVAARFDWVQSVDRLKLAERLSRQRPAALAPLNVCIQVHVGAEASKSGAPLAAAGDLARRVAALPQLRLRGLMAVPPPETDPARQRAWCRQLAALYFALQQEGMALDTLSMGMSDDLEAAVAEGATMVRIGTAIFGPRA
ncbi:YggS family pyridoxal phosphate-dependent enzyme [Thioalkalivibrio sp. XN279]|uniref:YggS family pyridoxal phosphate-dependent enzyme n=1 Tax=Thioalkalivibrio sp. XN279 TaxID=2714953 RepID=UPI00140A24CB|nr:YggS family pyridoxal phosphate-dependent enzyme [Thioalkalivibrio sp. XN279]NHA14083.1 YggS family pyridoxal phosphate-dependent enzyme [Thioalkalivibrio sp. XN279]